MSNLKYTGFGNPGYLPNYGGAFAVDYDRDGRITEKDFVAGSRMMGWGASGEEIARISFRSYDKDGNGVLNYNDMRLAYGQMDRLNR